MSRQSVESVIPYEVVQGMIFLIRGKKVMIDRDLARLYGVATKVFNQSVKRNINRFPEDFMFQLSKGEAGELVTNCDRFKMLKHSTACPYAFTEQGVAMLSSVLNSDRAIQVNIAIMRTFTKLKEMLFGHKELKVKIEVMEKKYDRQFQVVFKALKALFDEPEKGKNRSIGFHAYKK